MAKARKEIDKEAMYQKIMPSAMRDAKLEMESGSTGAKKAPTRRPPQPKPRIAPESVAAQEPERTQVAEPAPIINIMETLLAQKIDFAIEKFHCCTCDQCRRDITAIALNKLQPKYVVADETNLALATADKETNTQVTTALVQAILKVKSNPNHS